MPCNSILRAIGNTPLVKVNLKTSATMLAKLEYLNPGGSVKDRPALYMIEKAEKLGLLKQGHTIIDASSGNYGIALAMIGAIKGYRVIICVSEKISQEKLQTIKAYGAQVIVCPVTSTIEDPKSYHSTAVALQKKISNSFMPNQYFNIVNATAHYKSLGPEIWKQTGGKITHFVAGAGTGGTISGAGKYFKEKNKNIKIIAVDTPNSFRATKGNPKPYKIEGIGIDFDSDVLNYSVINDIIEVSDEDAFSWLPLLASQHGLLVGLSSGAVAYAANKVAKNLSDEACLVMIFGDSGRAYLTKNVFTQTTTQSPFTKKTTYKEKIL